MSATAPAAILAILLSLLRTFACSSPISVSLPDEAGRTAVQIALPDGVKPAAVSISLDGEDVRGRFTRGAPGLVGALPPMAPGSHRLEVIFPPEGFGLSFRAEIEAPEAAPALIASIPEQGALRIPRSAWIRLAFEGALNPEAGRGWGFGIECDGERVERSAHVVEGNTLILNPQPRLPAGSACRVVWRGPGGGVVERAFAVAADSAGPGATVTYDRTDPSAVAPFPDDYWLVDDASTESGKRVALESPPVDGNLLRQVVDGVVASIDDRDGFSPVQPIILDFSHAVAPASLPADEFASIDPFAPVALFDLHPASPTYGERIPFTMRVRSDRRPDAGFDYTGILFPATMLREGGRYALVLTTRVHAAGSPGRPFGMSDFSRAVAGEPEAGEPVQVSRARESVGPVLDFLAALPELPIPSEDVALALGFSIRSRAFDPADLVAAKEAILAAPPPQLNATSVSPQAGRAAVIHGTIELPSYLEPETAGVQISRDPATGRPVPSGTDQVPFVLTLPVASLSGPVPIVFYQHGSPGSPEEVRGLFNEFLDDAGYAMIGIQDVDNRIFGESIEALTQGALLAVAFFGGLPLHDFQTFADMLGLLRAIQGLGERSWLPIGAPDAVPEIDPTRVLYRGISQGSNYSLGFLPLAPEVLAAAAVVGGGRSYENVIHQVDTTGLIEGIQSALPQANPGLILFGLAVLQNDADRQDPHYLARHLYRDPLAVAGQADQTPPSLLWIEGIGDSWVSNTATRAAAEQLGIPQVRRIQRATPILEQADSPLASNLAPDLTGGHFQYDPVETPSCVQRWEFEGHFCPQIATEAQLQILHFFQTALEGGAAEIRDFLP
jgi:hypothetical protein